MEEWWVENVTLQVPANATFCHSYKVPWGDWVKQGVTFELEVKKVPSSESAVEKASSNHFRSSELHMIGMFFFATNNMHIHVRTCII